VDPQVPRRLYIRPEGKLLADASAAHKGPAKSLVVAGRNDLQFTAAEVIERDAGAVRRQSMRADELSAPADVDLQALLQRVRQPREPVAGLMLDKTLVMGIVNVTPDSFSDGGRYLSASAAIEHALRLEAEGADILDIGGESTRPGSDGVDLDEECRRVLKPGGLAIFQVYNRISWLNALSKLMKVDLEHDDAPVLLKFSIGEFRRLLSGFSEVRIVPERFPVKSRLHGGWKGALYNGVFVGTFNLLPRAVVGRFGWHLLAFCRK
jgi:hypothetical protein